MIIRAVIYTILVEVVISLAAWMMSNLLQGMWGGVSSLLIAPFLAGYIIYVQDGPEIQQSDKWLYSAVSSLVYTVFAAAFFLYYLGTPEGIALSAKNNAQSGIITNLVYAFCFLFIFLVFLFINRVGFGLGLKYGNYTNSLSEKVTLKINS